MEKITKQDAIQAVLDEPEYPGEMSDELYKMLVNPNNRDVLVEAFRRTVVLTKENIIKRINEV